jgi:uncharacterized protein
LGDIDKRLVLALPFSAFFGTMAGVEVLKAVGPEYIRLGVGVLVVLFALLLVREIRIPSAGTRWRPIVAGSASGALSTSTGHGGPPVVLLLASRSLPKHAFRGSSALYFLFISAVGFAVLVFRSLVDSGDVALVLVLALVPVALLGKLVGTELVKRISEKSFRKAALGITLITGAPGIATALWALA